MGVPKISLEPMTVEDFLEFTDGRPDDEKWELIDGQPVMNATSSRLHQIVVANLLVYLAQTLRQRGSGLRAIPGIGVRVANNKLPVPDIMVAPLADLTGRQRSTVVDQLVAIGQHRDAGTRDDEDVAPVHTRQDSDGCRSDLRTGSEDQRPLGDVGAGAADTNAGMP